MNPSQGKKIIRNRSGCWACKNRRRRCTEEKPICSGCAARGLLCQYGTKFLWEDAAKEAGIAFGRVGMKARFISKDDITAEHYLLPNSNKRLVFLNTTYADIYRFCQEYCDPKTNLQVAIIQNANGHGSQLETPSPSPWSVRMSGYASHMDSKSSYIFDYYINVLCHRKVFIDSSENPFRHLVLPLCHSSEELLHAVIAVSANDLKNRHDEVNNHWYEEKLLEHKLKSLGALRAGLDLIPLFPNDIIERDSMLLTILMHCYLEIASGSRYEWTTHLEGARSIIEHHHDRQFSSSTLQFATEYFSIRDIFSATATDQHSHSWDGSFNGGVKIRIDIGLSHELLDIISATTTLARGKHRLRREGTSTYEQESEFLQSAVVLQHRLENLHQWSEEEDEDHLLYWNAAAFKEAAHIYLRHGGFDEAIESTAIQNYEVNLLTLLQKVHEKQGNSFGTSPYPMWALFIASCAAVEENRATTLRFFDELNTSWPVSNVPTTMAAVEAIWKMRDLRGGTLEKRQGFEWDEALSRLGWKMPLT